jgi:hypothetical protein
MDEPVRFGSRLPLGRTCQSGRTAFGCPYRYLARPVDTYRRSPQCIGRMLSPAWAALDGAVALAVGALARRRTTLDGLVMTADPLFCVFVAELGVVVIERRQVAQTAV